MIFFQINGRTITSPKDISHSYDILDKVDRTIDGTMVVDIVGKKAKLDVTWDYLSREDMIILNNEMQSSSFISINFRDIDDGQLTSASVKVKDVSYSPGYDWVNNKVIWRNVFISFEER